MLLVKTPRMALSVTYVRGRSPEEYVVLPENRWGRWGEPNATNLSPCLARSGCARSHTRPCQTRLQIGEVNDQDSGVDQCAAQELQSWWWLILRS